MVQPIVNQPTAVEVLLHVDDLSYAPTGHVNVDTLESAVADAMRTGKVLELPVVAPNGRTTTLLLNPGNARAIYVEPGPFPWNGVGKPHPKVS